MKKELELCECGTPMFLRFGMILTCQDPDCPIEMAKQVCLDCGEEGELTGHMSCQYPQDRN